MEKEEKRRERDLSDMPTRQWLVFFFFFGATFLVHTRCIGWDSSRITIMIIIDGSIMEHYRRAHL